MPEAVRRAQDDLAAGRPWKARERLRSYVNAYPTDDKALALLGEVHSSDGRPPRPAVQERLRARMPSLRLRVPARSPTTCSSPVA